MNSLDHSLELQWHHHTVLSVVVSKALAYHFTLDSLNNFHTVCFLGLEGELSSKRAPDTLAEDLSLVHPYSSSKGSNKQPSLTSDPHICSQNIHSHKELFKNPILKNKNRKKPVVLLIDNILGEERTNELNWEVDYSLGDVEWISAPLFLHAHFAHLRGHVQLCQKQKTRLPGHFEFFFFLRHSFLFL